MIYIIGIAVGLLVLFWACLKSGSDADDQMGYDNIIEERVDSDGI